MTTPRFWFGPPDAIAQRSTDFPRLFDDPDAWRAAARAATGFRFTITYLLRAPAETVRTHLAFVRQAGLAVDVVIPALPVNKNQCGHGVEGLVWPGEVPNMLRQLQELTREIDVFSLDEPLTYGHFYAGHNACQLSLEETARRLGTSLNAIRAAYPGAKIHDAEAPPRTREEQDAWTGTLGVWLDLLHREHGQPLDAVSLDFSWNHPWEDLVRGALPVLRQHGAAAAIFLNANPQPTPADWAAAIRRNWAAFLATGVEVDDVLLANWTDMRVPNLPDSDPDSLAGLLLGAAQAVTRAQPAPDHANGDGP